MSNYKIERDELDFLQTIGGSKPQDEKLYGFIPGRWLPNWVKQGYNQSIEGMAQQVLKGKPVFKTDVNYDPSMLEDIGATVVSFLTPTDFAAMALGGGVGGLALKASSKQAVSKLVQSGMKKELAEAQVAKASGKVFNQARQKALTGATGLGFYSGLQSALGQQVTEGDIQFTKTLKDAATGAALGAGTGGISVASRAIAKTRGLGPKATLGLEKGSETVLFGTAGPLLEGELPTAESYIHAAGVIGGLTLSRAAKNRIFKSRTRQLEGEELEAVYLETASARNKIYQEARRTNEVWTDGNKQYKVLSDWTVKDKDRPNLRIVEVKKDGTNGKEISLPKSEFFKSPDKGGFRLLTNKKGQNVDTLIQKTIFKIKENLKISDDTFRQIINTVSGKDFGERPSKSRSTKKKKVLSTNYDLLKNDYKSRVRILREMESRKSLEDYKKKTKAETGGLAEVTGKSLLEVALPKSVYSVLTALKPTQLRVGSARYKPLFNSVKKDFFQMDRDRATLTAEYAYQFENAVYTTRDGKKIKGVSRLNKKQRQELGEDLQSKDSSDMRRVSQYRTRLDRIYKQAEKAGVEVAKFEDNYFPRKLKKKLLKILRDDIEKFGDYDSRTFSFNLKDKAGFEQRLQKALETRELAPETIQAIESMRQQMSAGRDRTVQSSEAFERIRNEVFSEIVISNKNLSVARNKATLPDFFFEKDAGTVLYDYSASAAKSIAFTKTAGKKGAQVYDKIKALKEIGGHQEAELLYKAVGTFTGAIELDRRYNWNPKSKSVLNDLVNIQVATKIGLGFASIPNVTQSFISSVLKAGYAPFVKGTFKMITDKNYRAAIRRYSGASSLELQTMLAGFNPAEMSFTAKAADRITKFSGFQGINKINKLIASYTGFEAALKWQRIAKTSTSQRRRDWAKSNLEGMGIKNPNKKLTQKNMAGAMYEFSRDTQLQRNVFREPAFFNDPRFQPFVLFKRFGYRQFEWLQGELRKEVKAGNAAILLRLGVAGVAGGTAVNYAKNALSDLLAGKDVYDESYTVAVDGKNFTFTDFIDAFASVGAAGIVSDIIASESKWRALEFAAKPAIIQDAGKAYTALQRVIADVDTFGPTAIVAQRAIRNVAPAFGSAGRRMLERLETDQQRKDYVKFRFGRTRARILDLMIEGDVTRATRLIKQWNNSFPDRILTYDDIGPDSINQRLMRKYKKQINP